MQHQSGGDNKQMQDELDRVKKENNYLFNRVAELEDAVTDWHSRLHKVLHKKELEEKNKI